MDPRTVPLPHGTQVTTTVELRPSGEGPTIPSGSVGTVVEHLAEGRLRVRIVGRGEHVLERQQLRPSKAGQVRYAIDRAHDEATPAALDHAFELLDRAREDSSLPEEPSEPEALEAWLVEVRRSDLAGGNPSAPSTREPHEP